MSLETEMYSEIEEAYRPIILKPLQDKLLEVSTEQENAKNAADRLEREVQCLDIAIRRLELLMQRR